MGKKNKSLHGNNAKVDPQKDVASVYATNQVTMPQTNRDHGEVPITNDLMAEDVRKFSEENKK